MSLRSRCYSVFCLGALSMVTASTWGAVTYTELGTFTDGTALPPFYSASSIPTGVSNDGIVVGNSLVDVTTFAYSGFTATASSGLSSFPVPDGYLETSVQGISADGLYVVGTAMAGDFSSVAFRWSALGGFEILENPLSSQPITVNGVSRDGSTIYGALQSPGGDTAFTWDAVNGFTTYTGREITAVSSDGSILYGYNQNFETVRFLSPTESVTLADTPEGEWNTVRSVSDDGSVIVGDIVRDDFSFAGYVQHGEHGFVLELEEGQEPYSPFGLRGGVAVTPDGQIVVGGDRDPLIWTAEDGTRRLMDILLEAGYTFDEFYTLERIVGISDDGRYITGFGTYQDTGDTVAFLIEINDVIPEPSTVALLFGAVALGASILLRRRRP